MSEILTALLALLTPVCMKRDKDLPWAIRIFRWGAIGLTLSYAVLCVIEKFREVFP